jgi:hypothetical protein
MKTLMAILIVLVVGIGAYKIYEHWNAVKERGLLEEKAAAGADIDPETLQGMPWQLLVKLREAQAGGPDLLKRFLDECTRFPDVKDPRLAWVQLDYAVMISSKDPVEAKKIYAQVKQRTPPDSPIWPRLRQLAKTYE